MKRTLILGTVALVTAGLASPQMANATIDATLLSSDDVTVSIQAVPKDQGAFEIARQGRGRGRGGDDDGGSNSGHGSGDDDNRDDDGGAEDNSGDDESGSGRSKPRIPGGSGCDDAGDVMEHAGCRS